MIARKILLLTMMTFSLIHERYTSVQRGCIAAPCLLRLNLSRVLLVALLPFSR